MSWQDHWQKKVISPQEIERKVAELRSQGHSIATLNGSFDLLHAGHMYMLHEASQVADVLIVALNTDSSVKSYKGEERPIITLEHRLQMLSALGCVDFLTWFDESDPCALLARLRPDVHVNGEEYGSDCIEAETVRAVGGRLHLVPRIPNLSTSEVIEKIQRMAPCV